MTTKTNVTNPPVPESGDPNGEGESQKELENRIRENLRAEYERKNQEMSERLASIEEEKAELSSRLDELTKSEKSRLDSLDDEKNNIKAQLAELQKPEYAGYREYVNLGTTKAKTDAINEAEHRTSVILMKEFIERKAEEEKITPKQLRDELNAILKIEGSNEIKHASLMPHDRVKVAYSERAERKMVQALKDENKRLLAERDAFSEDGSRSILGNKTVQELRDSAISGDTKSGIDLSKNLDARQKEYDSQLNKV